MEKRHWTSYKYGLDSLHNNIQLREIVLRSLFLFCCRACIYHSGHTRLLLFSSGRTLSNKADSEGYYDIPSRCITKHPSFLRSDVLLLQPYSVYSADKLNNFKGQHEGQGSLPLPLQTLSSEIITEPFNAVWWAASRSASCRLHRLAPGKEKAHFETVTLKYCILDNCLMESSKIENLINVWRRLDQAALKDIVFNSRWGERKSRSLLHLDI